MRRPKTVALRSLLLLPFVALLTLVPATKASAANLVDLTCAISGTADISPGVTLLGQDQDVSLDVQGGTAVSPATPCTSVTGVKYQGFTVDMSGTGAMSCSVTAFRGSLSGTGRVTWDNGDTSTAVFKITTVAMVPVVDVRLSKGALAGSRVLIVGIATSLTGNCVLNPITGLGYTGTMEILRAS